MSEEPVAETHAAKGSVQISGRRIRGGNAGAAGRTGPAQDLNEQDQNP